MFLINSSKYEKKTRMHEKKYHMLEKKTHKIEKVSTKKFIFKLYIWK